jgi:cell division protein FtsN
MRERLVVSVFIAILVHFVLFLVLQLVLKIEKSRVPEYSGPLYVTFEQVPSETPVMEREQEARQLPRAEREQPRVEQQQAEQAEGGVAAGLPRVRSVPAPETTQEPSERPRTGLRFLDRVETPASDERYLPPEEEAFQSPPAERQLSERPSPDRAVPVPRQPEVRPEEESEQPSVLDLGRLDSSLSGEGGAPAGESGSREGGPAAEPTVG